MQETSLILEAINDIAILAVDRNKQNTKSSDKYTELYCFVGPLYVFSSEFLHQVMGLEVL